MVGCGFVTRGERTALLEAEAAELRSKLRAVEDQLLAIRAEVQDPVAAASRNEQNPFLRMPDEILSRVLAYYAEDYHESIREVTRVHARAGLTEAGTRYVEKGKDAFAHMREHGLPWNTYIPHICERLRSLVTSLTSLQHANYAGWWTSLDAEEQRATSVWRLDVGLLYEETHGTPEEMDVVASLLDADVNTTVRQLRLCSTRDQSARTFGQYSKHLPYKKLSGASGSLQ